MMSPSNTKSGMRMNLRKSQLKFAVPKDENLTLRIVSTTADANEHQALFFTAILKALEDFGADSTKLVNIYEKTYHELAAMSDTGLGYLQDICRVSSDEREAGMKTRHALLKLALRLRIDLIRPPHYSQSFLAQYLTKLAEQSRDTDLFKIPIPGSYFAMGLTDDYKILQPNEVYIRARGKVRSGPVLIYRDPVLHIGDIRKATALTEADVSARMKDCADRKDWIAAMETIDDAIFFSQKDNPPFPRRLSGGDLDGDRFEILTDLSYIGEKGSDSLEASNYAENEAHPRKMHGSEIGSFDSKELSRFVSQYIQNDCFAELQDTLMCLADQKPTGMNDEDVKDLAKWLSQAVDYAKSGNKVDLTENVLNHSNFEFAAKPDFLRAVNLKAFYDAKGEYYESSGLLGRIYRMVKEVQFIYPEVLDNAGLRDKVADAWASKTFAKRYFDIEFRKAKFEKVKTKVDCALEGIIKDLFEDYCKYLQDQGICGESEVDIFFRPPLDEFPDQHIRSLKRGLLNLLSVEKITRVESLSEEGGNVFTFGDQLSPEAVEFIYRSSLFQAW